MRLYLYFAYKTYKTSIIVISFSENMIVKTKWKLNTLPE